MAQDTQHEQSHEQTALVSTNNLNDMDKSLTQPKKNTPGMDSSSDIGHTRQSTRRRLDQDEELKAMNPIPPSTGSGSGQDGRSPQNESVLQEETRIRLMTTTITKWITINAVPLNGQHISEVVAVARRDGYNILPGIEK